MPMPDSPLPSDIRAALEAHFGALVTHVRFLGGGDVNHAAKVDFADASTLFVKWHPSAPPAVFDAEADGLRALGTAGGIRVPNVLLVSESPAFLALEYIAPTTPRDPDAFSRRFAESLAGLHRATLRSTFGYDRDNYLGSQPQRNLPLTDNWLKFYRDDRLIPQIGRGIESGTIPSKREWALMDVLNALPQILGGMPPDASLLHGDLWSGNFLCATGEQPVLLDPAVYYAPREMELAYIELFGGFPQGFWENYHAAFPLDAGYARRRSLHQLYPLLIHLNHFGETYGPAVDRVCAEYAGFA